MKSQKTSFWHTNRSLNTDWSKALKIRTSIYLSTSLLIGSFLGLSYASFANPSPVLFMQTLVSILAQAAVAATWLFPLFLVGNIGFGIHIAQKNQAQKNKILFFIQHILLALFISLAIGAFLIATAIASMPVIWFAFVR